MSREEEEGDEGEVGYRETESGLDTSCLWSHDKSGKKEEEGKDEEGGVSLLAKDHN